MGLMADMAAAAGEKVFDTALQYYSQKNLNRQQQANYQKNLKLAAALDITNQRKAIEQSTQALRNAGLSPVLAASGNFSAPAVSAAMGTAGQMSMSGASLPQQMKADDQREILEDTKENLKSQTQLNKAAASKAQAEADSTNLNVKHGKSFDTALAPALVSIIDEMKESTDNPFMKGFLEDFVNNNPDVDLGTLKAFNETWFNLSQRERDRELDFIAKEMDKKVLSMQYSNGAAEALADMPKAQRLQIYRNMALMDSQIASLDAETSLTEDKRNAIRASIQKLGQETLSILHHDPAALWQAGEISSLGVMLGYEGIKAAANGVGFGLGAAVGSRVGGSAFGALKTRQEVSKMTKSEVIRQLELSRNEIKALKTAKESAARNKRLGELYKENKDLLDRLKSFGSTDYMR